MPDEKKVPTLDELKKPIINERDGRLLQRNEGKYKFYFLHEEEDEESNLKKKTRDPQSITLVVEVSKYLDTSFIDVDVHPTYITVAIKNKILQLNLDEEVSPDDVVCERSRMTGDLVIRMLKAKYKENAQITEIHENWKLERR